LDTKWFISHLMLKVKDESLPLATLAKIRH
jgi:hypothetical protein